MSRYLTHPIALLIALVCVGSPGCGDRDATGPPTLYLGADVCDLCKMIISDQNFAAACIVRSADGRARSAAFDDIGCLLGYEQSLADGTLEQQYVTDYDDGAWLNAAEAFYIQGSEIRSPMASGIIASRTQAGAELLAARFKGSVLRFDELDDLAGPGDFASLREAAELAAQPTEAPAPVEGEATQEISE